MTADYFFEKNKKYLLVITLCSALLLSMAVWTYGLLNFKNKIRKLQTITYLLRERSVLESGLEAIDEVIESGAPAVQLNVDPLIFKEKTIQYFREIKGKAESAGIELGAVEGFEEYKSRLAEKKEFPIISEKLRLLDLTVSGLVQAGITDLTDISFADASGKAKSARREIVLSISFLTTPQRLVSFLEFVESGSRFIDINDFEVQNRTDKIYVSMNISSNRLEISK